MELQDAPVAYFFKLGSWYEANKIRVAWGGGIILVAAGLISFYSWERDQNEMAAGRALTQLMLNTAALHNTPISQQADQYLKIAADYHSTAAGQRALLQGAGTLFTAGRYADAQAQFQKFLDAYPGSPLGAQADLGLATSLDAQGKTDLAVGVYQRIIRTYSDAMVANSARYSLAQIDERQGKLTEATGLYDDISRAVPGSLLASEAGLHSMELKLKLPAVSPATPPSPSFNLTH